MPRLSRTPKTNNVNDTATAESENMLTQDDVAASDGYDYNFIFLFDVN